MNPCVLFLIITSSVTQISSKDDQVTGPQVQHEMAVVVKGPHFQPSTLVECIEYSKRNVMWILVFEAGFCC